VSYVLPTVSSVSVPLLPVPIENQSETPPALPAWFGSPGSFVAPASTPLSVPLPPESVRRFYGATVRHVSDSRSPALFE
jgi:hypothetical protein